MYNFITIEGNIGAGKTTLSTLLSKHYNARLILEEFAENPFLAKFYENQQQYAFPLELFFILAELKHCNVEIQTIAPKFTGLFAKGVDYIGHVVPAVLTWMPESNFRIAFFIAW